jgi:hypothetical protein
MNINEYTTQTYIIYKNAALYVEYVLSIFVI